MPKRGRAVEPNIGPVLIVAAVSYLALTGGLTNIGQWINGFWNPGGGGGGGGGVDTTKFTLTIKPATGGTTDPPPGTYTYEAGKTVTVTSIPDTDYTFQAWINADDVNPVTLTMSRLREITPIFKSTSNPNEPIVVNEPIYITENFDGAGRTYVHGPLLGDQPLIRVSGTGVTLSNLAIDDGGYFPFLGVFRAWSPITLGGTDCTIRDISITNCVRYAATFSGALRGTYHGVTITNCQHGISGSSGYEGDWRNPSTNCIIEDCNISGMSVDGVKLKQMVGTIVRNNNIDCGNENGIYFAATDTANKNCIIEGNTIWSSTHSGIGINIHQDQQEIRTVTSTGNIVRNNKITDTGIGIRITGSHYTVTGNTITSCTTPIRTQTLIYKPGVIYPPPSDNTVSGNTLN